jgi:hypothetical protein
VSTAVIYHDQCPDGWCAAWVAYNALKSDGGLPVLHPMSYGQPVPNLDGVDTVYLVDFSLPHAELVALAETRRVVVLDHHQTAIDDICGALGWEPEPGSNVPSPDWPYAAVLDVSRSGAGITWDYFHSEPRPPVVDYVEDRDLWRFALPRSKAVNAYLRTQPYALGAWDDIDQYLTVTDMAIAGEGVLLHIGAYCRAATNHAYWCEMGDRRFPIVNVTYESCSEVADHLLSYFGCDMAGYFFETGDGMWQYGFRSRNGVTVHDHAKAFGGGGHPQASGCRVPVIAHRRADA